MMYKQTKRFGCIPLLPQPVYTQVSNDIRHIPFLPDSTFRRDKIRIIIIPLSGQNSPIIKTGRCAPQMPFSNHSRLVTACLQQLLDSLLFPVKHRPAGIIGITVLMAVLPRQQNSTARTGKRITNKTIGKSHSFSSNTVKMGSLHISLLITTHHLLSMVVCHDIYNVQRLFLLRFLSISSTPVQNSQTGQRQKIIYCLHHSYYRYYLVSPIPAVLYNCFPVFDYSPVF